MSFNFCIGPCAGLDLDKAEYCLLIGEGATAPTPDARFHADVVGVYSGPILSDDGARALIERTSERLRVALGVGGGWKRSILVAELGALAHVIPDPAVTSERVSAAVNEALTANDQFAAAEPPAAPCAIH